MNAQKPLENTKLTEIKPIYIHDTTAYQAEDEISLVDLAMILIHRKILISAIILLCSAIGLVIALLTPRIYTYSTSIESGSQIINGKTTYLESADALVAKIQRIYIPSILAEQEQKNTSTETQKSHVVEVSIPENSNIILLEAKGSEDQQQTLNNLFNNIVLKINQSQHRLIQTTKDKLSQNIHYSQNKLKNLQTYLKKSNPNDKLEDRFQLIREKTSLENYIANLTSQLSSLRKTHAISQTLKSPLPTGTSHKLIVIISIFAGLFLGMLAVFLAEFRIKIKEKQQEES